MSFFHQPFPSDPASWRTRGYLPHYDHPGTVQALTFRLADSLPAELYERWERELRERDSEEERVRELSQRCEHWLDAGHGQCLLQRPECAEIVENAMLHFNGVRYRLRAWCIMPNHVHCLAELHPEFQIGEVVHSWKSWSANRINALLGRSGALWQREYHDRLIRDRDHLGSAIRYIHRNPVKAGLCALAEDFRWSSAWKRRADDVVEWREEGGRNFARRQDGERNSTRRQDGGAPSGDLSSDLSGAAEA